MPEDFLSLSIPCTATILLGMLSEPNPQAPRFHSIEPSHAGPGAVISASGTGLANLPGVLISDGRSDLTAVVTQQSDSAVKFSVPQEIRPGRQRIRLIYGPSDRRQIADQSLELVVEVAQ